MNLAAIGIGAALLLFGRKLFWLFVAAAGFLAGMEAAGLLLSQKPLWMQLALALGAGLIGALVAMVAQRVAFGLAGFLAGGYLGLVLMHTFCLFGGSIVILLACGLIGAVAAILLMDRAITTLSSLVGAGAIVSGLKTGLLLGILLFFALALFGYLVQQRLFTKPAKKAA